MINKTTATRKNMMYIYNESTNDSDFILANAFCLPNIMDLTVSFGSYKLSRLSGLML